MATKLLARAERAGRNQQLWILPRLRRAVRKVAAEVEVLIGTPPTMSKGEVVLVLDT